MDMDRYVRNQAIIAGLALNLKDLEKQRETIAIQLCMVEKMIEKHESYLAVLEEEMED